MKVNVISKGDRRSDFICMSLIEYLKPYHFIIDTEEPEFVIAVGGDGTMLHAFHKYKHRLEHTVFLGIHTGHLGFYADWSPDQLKELVHALRFIPYQIGKYPLLEVTVWLHNGEKEVVDLALNEGTVRSEEGTFVIDVELRGQLFETFRGDGLCISTPSGSTGYNKGLGGAIVHPSLEAIQLTEMASINNRVFRTLGSPLILPSSHTVVLRPVSSRRFVMTLDQFRYTYDDVKYIQYRVAKEHIRFARFQATPFWNRVRNAFIH